jgi:hypothetical protein
MKKQLSIMLLILVSLGAYAQHDHSAHASSSQEKNSPAFKDDNIGTAYTHYVHLKDALVASNAADAKKAAEDLQKSLSGIAESKSTTDAAKAVSSTSDLNQQRKAFSTLSNEMTTLVKTSKLSSGTLYIEYCPMANSNEGAFWLSNEKEIKNPYFGDMMLTCGSVKETIK